MSSWPVYVRGVLILLLMLGGCTPESEPAPDSLAVAPPDSAEVPAPDPFPEFARRATAIEIALDDYRRVESTGTAGDAATFTAYLDGDALRLIEETRRRAGEATTVYYFAGGAPFYVVQDEPDEARRTRVAFGPDGAIVAAERIEDDEPGEAPPAEAEALWAHALALAAQVPPPEPL